jgi:hypothetical protein
MTDQAIHALLVEDNALNTLLLREASIVITVGLR